MADTSDRDIRIFNGPRRLEKAMHMLEGIVRGVTLDRRLNDAELRALRNWMDEKPHLHSCWPFDEVNSIISAVLADGKVDAKEHEMILHFFADVMTFLNHKSLNRKAPSESSFVGGICAVAPAVRFDGHSFCFTGTPKRGPKRELQRVVEENQGTVKTNVVKDLDYLVIGADGNECWAYSAYGRKVEQAIEYRKSGEKITIVHEFDFWDAVEDAGRPIDE